MTKICSKCDIKKELSEYRRNLTFCKECESNTQIAYYNTLNGKFRCMLNHAKERSKKRLAKGRIEACIFEITGNDLQELWEKQNGLCYYSNLPMKYDEKQWMMSLERINSSLGYTKDNIVFCCAELNIQVQWSHAKINELLNILDNTIKDNTMNFELFKKPRRKAESIEKTIINGDEYYNCNHCHEIKQIIDFTSKISNGCKQCQNKKDTIYNATPRGGMLHLFNTAKKSTEYRNKTKNNKRTNEFDIDFDYLVEIFNNQKGLCAISGIPMKFGNCEENNWACSLERIDPLLGYIKGNVCFICYEFNTPDYTSMYKEKQTGSGAWTKEKFKTFIDSVRAHKNRLVPEPKNVCVIQDE